LYIIFSFQAASVLTAILEQPERRIQNKKDKVEKPEDERGFAQRSPPHESWQAVSGTVRYRSGIVK
jgi:hypothetical protein